jgi:hypothetical protein
MRVAIDATPLTLSSGGLRRYTEELSVALAETFPQDEFFLVSDQPFRMPHTVPLNLRRGGGPRHPAERRWWLWGLDRELRRLEAELFHGTDFAVPYVPRLPSVLTLHDLSPWMNAAWHSDADRVRQRTPLLIGLGAATMVRDPQRGGAEGRPSKGSGFIRVASARSPHARRRLFPSACGTAGPSIFSVCRKLWNRARTSQDSWPPGAKCAALHSVDLVLAGRTPIRFRATFTRVRVADYGRGVRRSAGAIVGGSAGVRLSVAL